MATLTVCLSDDLKRKWQGLCAGRGIPMSSIVVHWIENDVAGGANAPHVQPPPETRACQVCGHTWTPQRGGRPAACPRCKSYRWDDEDRPARKKELSPAQMDVVARRNEKIALREQKRMYGVFHLLYKQLQRMTQYRSCPEVAALIGTTGEKLAPYVQGKNPVTAAQVARMQAAIDRAAQNDPDIPL